MRRAHIVTQGPALVDASVTAEVAVDSRAVIQNPPAPDIVGGLRADDRADNPPAEPPELAHAEAGWSGASVVQLVGRTDYAWQSLPDSSTFEVAD